MFKRVLPLLVLLIVVFGWQFVPSALAQSPTSPPAAEGQWIPDKDVTFAGKIATRASDMLNWVIRHHGWSSIAPGKATNNPEVAKNYDPSKEIGGDNLPANPFAPVWIGVRNVVFSVLVLFVFAAAVIIIISRGQSLTIKKFAPWFILTLLLIFLSFSLIQFLYQIVDIFQGFFLLNNRPQGPISSQDLLSISFDYNNFEGFRKAGIKYDESAFISLLLVWMTAITYYVMFGILIIRKIILWLFIILSPVYPVLFLFKPLRNTAKVWTGEFFRWLLYAPLFSILLAGLVTIWSLWSPAAPVNLLQEPFQSAEGQQASFVGLPCGDQINGLNGQSPENSDSSYYPTSINILLGGPCQVISEANSVNVPSAFIEYVIALLMLWMVIILPFVLLKIFLDYYHNFSFTDSNMIKYLAKAPGPLMDRYRSINRPSGSPSPTSGAPAGKAMSLPTFDKLSGSEATNLNSENQSAFDGELAQALSQNLSQVENRTNQSTQQNSSQVTNNYNQSSDSAGSPMQIESSNYQRGADFNQREQDINVTVNQENQITSSIESIFSSAPSLTNTAGTQQTNQILQLTNLAIPTMADIAKLEAALMSHKAPERTHQIYQVLANIGGQIENSSPVEQQQISQVRQQIDQAATAGNPVASAILTAAEPAVQVAQAEKQQVTVAPGQPAPTTEVKVELAKPVVLPQHNAVQTVNLSDYEDVRKTWVENYRNMETPGQYETKVEWLNRENQQIDQVTNYLSSQDPNQVRQGQTMVSRILPFLLLGGFSQAEIVAYLKAKQSAVKQILEEDRAKAEDDRELVDRAQGGVAQQKSLEMSAEIDTNNQ